ncbi:MAG: DUF6259 domain-containing protein [Planctomycetota bacterium]
MTDAVRIRSSFFPCLLILLAPLAAAQAPKGPGKPINDPAYVLAHGDLRYEFTFDPLLSDIHLQSLENVATGEHFEFADRSLWEVEWIDPSNGNRVLTDSDVTQGVCTITTRTQGSDLIATLTWRRCALGVERFDVSIEIRIPASGPNSYWSVQVDGGSVLARAIFQTTLGLAPLQPSGEDAYAIVPSRGGLLVQNPAVNLQGNGAVNFIGNKLPFQLFPYYHSGGDGLYLATNDGAWDYKQLVFDADGESFWIGLEQFAADLVTIPSSYASSYEMVVGTYQGDWFDAAKRYRSWLVNQSWFSNGPLVSRSDIPTWWKELDLLSSHTFNPAADPNQIAADYDSVRTYYGIPADRMVVMQWNWYDGVGPYAPKANFLTQIHQMRNLGVRAMPYVWSYAYDSTDPTYVTNNIAPLTKKDVFGQPTIDPFSPGQTAIVDPSQAAWQAHLCSVIQALSPVDAIYVDNPFDTFPDYDASHGHSGFGLHMANGFRQLFEGLRSCLRPGNPDQVVGYEALFEGYVGTTEWVATPNPADGNRLTLSAWARYVPLDVTLFHDYVPVAFSNSKADYRQDIFLDDEDLLYVAAEGFTLGKVLTVVESDYLIGGVLNHLSADPLVQTYVAMIQQFIDIRRAQSAFLTYGQFLRPMTTTAQTITRQFRNRQLAVYSVDTVDIPSASFRAPDGRIGIVMVNPESATKGFAFTFRYADGGLTPGAPYELVDAETGSVLRTVTGNFTHIVNIAAYDVRFFILRPAP